MDKVDPALALVALEVARQGSLSAAARGLAMSQPTVSRHVRDLEEVIGAQLFVRHARGVRPTARAAEVLEAARAIEQATARFERAARGLATEVTGAVRVAASEIIGVEVIIPGIAELRRQHPRLQIELVLDNRAADLSRGDADIAVRLFQPRQLDVIARLIGTLSTGFYASRGYLDARGGAPATPQALLEHALIGFDAQGPMAQAFAAVDARFTPEVFDIRTDSLSGHLRAARSGAGVAVLQDLIAERYSELIRLSLDLEPPQMLVWLVAHEDVRHGAHVQAVWEWLLDLLLAYVNRLV